MTEEEMKRAAKAFYDEKEARDKKESTEVFIGVCVCVIIALVGGMILNALGVM